MSCGASIGFSPAAFAAAFTPGNIAVFRAGDGVQALANTGNTIFIDEYTPAGAFVQSIQVPDSGASALFSSGNATSEGALTLSPNKRWLSFTGYNTNRPTSGSVVSTPSSTVPRGVGTMDASGAYVLAASTTNQFSANNIRGAVTDGTNNFWASGANSGTYYFGFDASTNTIQSAILNTRVVQIFNGSLYFSTASGTRGVYGFSLPGLPEAPAITNLLIAPNAASSVYGFSISPDGLSAYTADDNAPTNSNGGLVRWTNNAGAWSSVYVVTTNSARGLVVDWKGANPILYASTTTNSLIRVIDTGAASAATLLVKGATSTAFRGVAFAPPPPTVNIVVTNRIYSPYRLDLAPASYAYVDLDPAAASPVRATQRSLGYREVDYKANVPGTLFFNQVTPVTNANTISYDYSTQAAKTNTVGFWVDKDVPMIIGPDGLCYITDGHHTTAGLLASSAPVRQLVPGKDRVILGHIVANYFDPLVGPQPVDDAWWTARQAENNALLYGPDGDQLTLPGEPNYASLQPILPSVLAMPTTPSTITGGGVVAMTPSIYRGLTWGMADAIVQSGLDSSGKKIAGYKKSAPGSSVDINFVEFFWADYMRHRIVWDDTLSGSPFNSPNGDASVTAAPLSFFTAVANGIALGRSEVYHDEYGRNLVDHTNSAVFGPNALRWANGSLSNGLALATDTYNLYLRDDSTFVGDISPSAKSTNILHIDTVSGLTVTQTLQNLKTIVVNAGGTLKTSWKDATVSNSTLRLPAGSGVVTVTGNNFVAGNTILGGGMLDLQGTLGGALQVTNGTLKGNGTINGAVAVLASGTVSPGASIGVITINGPLTLGAATVMEADKTGATLTSDLINGITTLTYGGTLTLTATGDPLVAGDSFKLFDAANYTGSFASLALPALTAGLAWDSSRLLVDGTIQVGLVQQTPPAIAAQPSSQTVDVGANVTLTSGAVGTEPITYQWQFNGNDLGGKTQTTLSLPNIQEASQGQYALIAQNSADSATSVVATVTVNQRPSAQAQSVTMYWNTSRNIVLTGSDPDGDGLTYSVVSQPGHGTLTGAAPNVTYAPASGFSGSDSFTFKVNDGRLDSAVATVSITVKLDFSYTDTDLLLVFRRANALNDLIFNLGSISNYLGQANGSTWTVSGFDFGRVQSVFGPDLTGVKYVLAAVTRPTPASAKRTWLSDSEPTGVPTDESPGVWSQQFSTIDAVGSRATAYSYPDATNQSVVIAVADPNSYTSIAGNGGLDVTTMGGSAPFVVEQDLGTSIRLFELKVNSGSPKPVAAQVGDFRLGTDGTLTFEAGIKPPAITAGPSDTTIECGSSGTLTVSATGDPTLAYQWRLAGGDISGANSAALVVSAGGSYTVVVSNGGGSVTSAPAVVTIVDTIPPVVTVPANITVTATSSSGAVGAFSASATDICAGSLTPACTPASGSTFPIGVTTVNCTANDGINTGSASFAIRVKAGFTYVDTDLLLVFRRANALNDLIFNLGTISNYLGQANGAMLTVSNFDFGRVQSVFGPDLTGVKYVLAAVTTPSPASAKRTWLSDSEPTGVPTDESPGVWSQQFSTIDAVGSRATVYFYPDATNQSVVIAVADPNSYTSIAGNGGLDVTTMGGSAPFVVEQALGVGIRLFELKVHSGSPKPAAAEVGHFTMGTDGTLTFVAGAVPLAITTGPSSQTIECGTNATFTVTATGDETLTYQWQFGGSSIDGATSSNLTTSAAGSYTVVVSSGGSSVTSAPAVLTVVDTTPPAIVCAAAKTIECGTAWTFDPPTATDVCDPSPVISIVTTTTNSACGLTFTATRTWAATDASNNTAQCSQTVTVVDHTPPTIVCAPAKTVECASVWDFDAPTASDICGSATVSIVSTVTNTVGHCGTTFVAVRTWQATDACGNTANCSQTVTSQATIVCGASKTVECGSAWTFDPPIVTGGCDPAPVITITSTVTNHLPCNGIKARRIWRVTDACGNHVDCTQIVTVLDATAPTVTCPGDQLATCASGGAVVTFSASVTDVCDPNPTVTCTPASGSVFPAGVTTVNCQGKDACGNTATCSFHVTVTDNTPPVVSVPANITVTATSGAGAIVAFSATASDACVGALSASCTPASGSTFPIGVTTVTCTATNSGGSTGAASFTIRVKPGFTYVDTDLLLVFRRANALNDLIFNLGTISNYLGQANGTMLTVSNFDFGRVQSVFGPDLTGVKYALAAVTTPSPASAKRTWLSDSESTGVPTDESPGVWSQQFSTIDAVGSRATVYFYPDATNQSVVIAVADPNSYTSIAGNGGLDVTTMGGSAPFVVEQDLGASIRLFELKVNSGSPKPVAAQVGRFSLGNDGSLTFTANLPPLAADDGATTLQNHAVNISSAHLLANDSDPDLDPLTVVSVTANSTNGGTVVLSGGTVTYTPVAGFAGVDQFSYTISDGRGGASTANVLVFVSDGPLPAPNSVVIAVTPQGIRLRFAGEPGRTYDILRSHLVTGPYSPFTTMVAPSYGIIEAFDSNPFPDTDFYRALAH